MPTPGSRREKENEHNSIRQVDNESSSSGSEVLFPEYSYNTQKHPLNYETASKLKDIDDHLISEEDQKLIFSHLPDRTSEEWYEILYNGVTYHTGDTLIPEKQMNRWKRLLMGPTETQAREEWEHEVAFEAFLFHEWSVYPEVRAVTRPIDEKEDPYYHSLRVYIIGTGWGICGSVLATFFALRFPSISLGSTSLQILIALSGKLCAALPRIAIPLGRSKNARKIVLNSGNSWTFKEQMLATLTMSVANGSPYAQYAIIAQANDNFYGFSHANNFGYMIMLILSSAFMGFGFAGIFRTVLVYPSRMVWYSVLPFLPLSRTLVSNDVRENVSGWKLKRWEFFWLMTIVWFCWYWITNTAATFLQYFNWICWIAPKNIDVNIITGSFSGLGLNPVGSFDPNIFGNLGGITTPLESYCNWMFGYFISFIAIIILFYNNKRWTGYLPINSNVLYDNTGNTFQVRKIIDPETHRLVVSKLQQYSLPFWSAGNLVQYGGYFMLYTAMVVYSILNYGDTLIMSAKALWKGVSFGTNGSSVSHFQDSFSRRQARLKEVPEWWFMIVFVCAIAISIACVEVYRFTETPVWSIFLGIGLAAVFIPISGILQATTTFGFETNVLIELIMGYAAPGNPNALMISKVFATNFFSQADNWITNQKQAHYAGVAPRALFFCQIVSTLCTCFVQTGIVQWQTSGGIQDLCNPKNKNLFTCQSSRTYFNASVQWGTLGPRRVFRELYPVMRYCFLFGAVYPIPFWILRKFLPVLVQKSGIDSKTRRFYWLGGLWLQHVNEVVMLLASMNWAPYNITYFIGDFYICILFQKIIKEKYGKWWNRYAYLLVSALSNGYGWAGFFDFFATQYRHLVEVDWWGNRVNSGTVDNMEAAVKFAIPPEGYFGPPKGTFR